MVKFWKLKKEIKKENQDRKEQFKPTSLPTVASCVPHRKTFLYV